MVSLKHLMEPNQPSLQGPARSAIWRIGQALERGRWVDLAHPKGRIFTLAGLRYVPLVVPRTKARNVPYQQTRITGQMVQSNQERL